ncbi:MAG: hypothetical protein KA155_07425 [Alphaproteobacteria bacterium]|jgi:hypothetical protein|nr:hypothetical protein [Alphaproteobacteria bacterium]
MDLRKKMIGIKNSGNSVTVISWKGHSMISNALQVNTPNNLHLHRDYMLGYVWNDDYFTTSHKPTDVFTGKEILEAWHSIPEFTKEQRQKFVQQLRETILISGRVETKRKLSKNFPHDLVERAQLASEGCEYTRTKLRKERALYIALHIDEIASDEVETFSEIRKYLDASITLEQHVAESPAVLFINDYPD